MKMRCLLIGLIFLLVFAVPIAAQENEGDVFADIVSFVVSRDPALQAQRSVINAAQALDTVETTESAGVPAYAQSSLLRMKYEAVSDVASAQQVYANLERQLVSDLFAKLTQILGLRNQIENNRELLQLLNARMEPTERQVQAGIVNSEVLWNLSERIIGVQIAIADSISQLELLEREAAFNYGGEDWSQLLTLIRRVR